MEMQYKPKYLPQISAPFNIVVDNLKKEGISYKLLTVDPKTLKPSQGIIFSDKMSKFTGKNLKPIWVSNDDHVIDGHHRYGSALANNIKIPIVKIDLDSKNTIRVLNKIQDIYEYENQSSLEEVVSQDQINDMRNDVDIIDVIDEEMNKIKQEYSENSIVGRDKQKFVGYRKSSINEDSNIGNFFKTKPIDGYMKFEIEFDNILDTDKLGIDFIGTKNPVVQLAGYWFPNIDFDKLGDKLNIKPIKIINRCIAEKAQKMGFDGIKYSDILIQGLK